MHEFTTKQYPVDTAAKWQWVFNSITPILEAALGGLGVGYLTKDKVKRYIDDGQLVQVLADWSSPFLGYDLYYPSHRQMTTAFALIVEALRVRANV